MNLLHATAAVLLLAHVCHVLPAVAQAQAADHRSREHAPAEAPAPEDQTADASLTTSSGANCNKEAAGSGYQYGAPCRGPQQDEVSGPLASPTHNQLCGALALCMLGFSALAFV